MFLIVGADDHGCSLLHLGLGVDVVVAPYE
jgi:hypothetical protein